MGQHLRLPATLRWSSLVFFTGGIVLCLEILAARVLAGYFGNTLYSISGVLSVILGALALGYYVGGLLVDKYRSRALLFSIIAFSGLATLFSAALTTHILPEFSRQLDFIYGPLWMSLLLFAPPSILLGMCSPYVLGLLTTTPQKSGSVAGLIFFWSTLGSITGSLLAGFWLIPSYGIMQIFITCGLSLMSAGLLGWFFFNKRHWWIMLIVLMLGVAATITATAKPSQPNVLFQTDGLYGDIRVVEGKRNGRPIRALVQDGNFSSAEYTDGQEGEVFDYTQFTELLGALVPRSKEITVVGAGAYTVPKQLARIYPEARIMVSEIEPVLEDLARNYFDFQPSPGTITKPADGRSVVRNSHSQDIIYLDAYQGFSTIPTHMTTKEFFTEVAASLSAEGVMMANIIGDSREGYSRFSMAELATIKSVFPETRVYRSDKYNSEGSQNLIVVARKSGQTINNAAIASSYLHNPYLVNLPAREVNYKTWNFSKHSVLTDNYAPVDYLVALDVRQHLR